MLFQLSSSRLFSGFLPTKQENNRDINIRDYYSELNSIVYPFKADEDHDKSGKSGETIVYRPPFAVCLHCHAYVNYLVQWNKVENSSNYCKWLCSLCNNLNYCESSSFISASAASTLPVELSSPSYHCIESQPILSSFLSLQKIIVIGIDLVWIMKEVIGRNEERKEEKRRKVREAQLEEKARKKREEGEKEIEEPGNNSKEPGNNSKEPKLVQEGKIKQPEEAEEDDIRFFLEILNRSIQTAFTASCSSSSSSCSTPPQSSSSFSNSSFSSVDSSIQLLFFFYDSSSIRIVRFNNENSFSSCNSSLSIDLIPFSQLNPVRSATASSYSSSSSGETEERERNADFHWKDLFQQGLYSLSLASFLKHVDKISSFLLSWLNCMKRSFLSSSSSLLLLKPTESSRSSGYSPSFEDFASFLNILQDCYSLVIPIEFFLFTNQSPPLFSTSVLSSSQQQQQMIDRLTLAKFYSNHLFSSIFLFFLGNDQLALHELVPFLSNASGSKLIVCERLQDDSFEMNLHSLLSSSFSLASYQMIAGGSSIQKERNKETDELRYFPEAVIEVRCNRNLDLLSLQGPLLSLSQLQEIQSNRSYRDSTSVSSSSSSSSHPQKYSHFASYKVGSMSFPSTKEEKSLRQEVEGERESVHGSSSFPSIFYHTYHLSAAYSSYLSYISEQRVLTDTSEIIPTSFSIFYDRIKSFYNEVPAKSKNFQQILFSSSIVVKKEEMEKLFLSASFQLLEQLIVETTNQKEGEEGKSSSSFVPQWLSSLLPASFISVPSPAAALTFSDPPMSVSIRSSSASSLNAGLKKKEGPSSEDHSIQLFANENEFENSYLSTGIIQITIKTSYYLLKQQHLPSSSSHNHERINEIKVYTYQLPVSSSASSSAAFLRKEKQNKKEKEATVSGMNRWELWNWITMRSIIQAYHIELEKQYYSQFPFSSSRKPFSSSRFQKLDEQGFLFFPLPSSLFSLLFLSSLFFLLSSFFSLSLVFSFLNFFALLLFLAFSLTVNPLYRKRYYQNY
jgi:hypothetical protein